MENENRPACEPNEPQAFLDYLEVQNELIKQFDDLRKPLYNPNCRCVWDGYPPITKNLA